MDVRLVLIGVASLAVGGVAAAATAPGASDREQFAALVESDPQTVIDTGTNELIAASEQTMTEDQARCVITKVVETMSSEQVADIAVFDESKLSETERKQVQTIMIDCLGGMAGYARLLATARHSSGSVREGFVQGFVESQQGSLSAEQATCVAGYFFDQMTDDEFVEIAVAGAAPNQTAAREALSPSTTAAIFKAFQSCGVSGG